MTRQFFDSDGLKLAYIDEGEGEPILLIHGFASNIGTNWEFPGWIDALKRAGRRVVAFDNRGHGDSDKPHDTAVYLATQMAEDARRLLDHLEIERADVMGYSMGARITAFLALNHPERVRSAIFGGLGMGMIEGVGDPEIIARALEAPSLQEVDGQQGRAFRAFAEQTGGDLAALAACMRSTRTPISREEIGALSTPVLVAVGSTDDIAGSPHGLADLIPGARAFEIPGRNHMQAVGDKAYKQAVLDFLAERP